MKSFWKILAAILGLFLAEILIPGVSINVIEGKSIYFGIKFTQKWQMIIFLGLIFGLMISFLRPILKLISLPLRILTFGIFSFIINLGLLWTLDLFFPELKFESFFSLLLTCILILILEAFLK